MIHPAFKHANGFTNEIRAWHRSCKKSLHGARSIPSTLGKEVRFLNFIIINPDEMRAESVACYGHPVVRTPHIDRLASQGTRFDQAHVQHPVCSPSRCSFMTGWYPHVNGHRTLRHLLRSHEPHLFKYLHEAGYDIRWYGKNDLLAESEFGCVTEFVRGSYNVFGPNPYNLEDPEYYSFLHGPYEGPVEEHSDQVMVRKAIEFLRSEHDKPFCVFLPITFPHPPYSAPQPWHDMYDPDTLPPLRPADLPNKPRFHEGIRRSRRLDQVDEKLFRKVNAVYLGMISYVDHLVGQILQALEETGLDESTTVLLFSDHGDFAGDYGLVEKWPSALDDTLTRVPLIIRTPGGAAGHVVKEPVEVFDIMATVLELAGVECRHTHFARSLVPQLRGEPGDPDRAVFAEGGYDPHEPHCFEGGPWSAVSKIPGSPYYPKGRLQQEDRDSVCRTVMIRTATHKLIRRTRDIGELYDLEKDPRELHNVYDDPAYASIRRDLETRLLDWYIRTSDQVPTDFDER